MKKIIVDDFTKAKIVKAHRYLGLTYDEIANYYNISSYMAMKICKENK